MEGQAPPRGASPVAQARTSPPVASQLAARTRCQLSTLCGVRRSKSAPSKILLVVCRKEGGQGQGQAGGAGQGGWRGGRRGGPRTAHTRTPRHQLGHCPQGDQPTVRNEEAVVRKESPPS